MRQPEMPTRSPSKPHLERSAISNPALDPAAMPDPRSLPRPAALAAALANAAAAGPTSGARTPSSIVSAGSPSDLAAKGQRYILTADDAEIRAMLLERLEREGSPLDHHTWMGNGAGGERKAAPR